MVPSTSLEKTRPQRATGFGRTNPLGVIDAAHARVHGTGRTCGHDTPRRRAGVTGQVRESHARGGVTGRVETITSAAPALDSLSPRRCQKPGMAKSKRCQPVPYEILPRAFARKRDLLGKNYAMRCPRCYARSHLRRHKFCRRDPVGATRLLDKSLKGHARRRDKSCKSSSHSATPTLDSLSSAWRQEHARATHRQRLRRDRTMAETTPSFHSSHTKACPSHRRDAHQISSRRRNGSARTMPEDT